MKTTCNKIVCAVAIVFAISSLCSCSKNLTRDKAEKLISEKYKFPYADMANIRQPEIKIWTRDWDWGEGLPLACKNMCMPSIETIDKIFTSGSYSNLVGFDTNLIEDWKQSYIAKGDFELYKEYKDMGLIEFQSVFKDGYVAMDRNGNASRERWDCTCGYYWKCIFSLTPKANELGINNWQYKAADWVLDDINGIFNNEANKTAEVEFTIKTANPTSTAKLFGGWAEKKQSLKGSFKLYDDGWRIE